MIIAFHKLPNIRYAEPPIIVAPLITPNDTYFNSQWFLSKIKASEAWDITKGSASIKVAIIDVGYASIPFDISNHEDFQIQGGGNKFVGGSLNNSSDHAREVAGIIGAVTDNYTGIASLGWNTSLMAWHYVGGTAEDNLGDLIDLARTGGADVINFSITTLGTCGGVDFCPQGFPSVQEAIETAFNAGIIMVAAAGNGTYPGCSEDCGGELPFSSYPANYNNYVIAVSGTKLDDNFYTGWNYGSFIDVAAPGDGIYTLYSIYNGYTDPSGTSFSAPQVSALVALILSINPSLTFAQIKSILEQSADKVGQYTYINGRNNFLGYGRINAYQALLLTLAYANKTQSSQSTSFNNQRKLFRETSGKLHEVFTSGTINGGEIFYRNSTNNGTSWNATKRLSDGTATSLAPCITMGTGSNVIVTWQQTNGSNYNVVYSRSTNGGSTWGTVSTIQSNFACGSPGPLPTKKHRFNFYNL